jgi:DMSO reductase anchor subunit
MLVLTQLSVGAFMSALWLERWLAPDIVEGIRPLHSLTALVFGLLALAASTLHLGRPQYAFRAIVGLRHSWLSREIVAFGVFAKLAVLYAVGNWLAPEWLTSTQLWRAGLSWSVGLSGLIGVGCSIMIYAVTQRPLWGLIATTVRFSLTSGLLGLAALWLTTLFLSVGGSEFAAQVMAASGERICQALVWLSAAKLLFEASLFRHLLTRQMTPLRRSARLMLEPFRKVTIARFICGVIGGIVMPLFLQGLIGSGQAEQTGLQLTVMTLLFVACLVGELLERFLFFGAVAAPRMPGALRS